MGKMQTNYLTQPTHSGGSFGIMSADDVSICISRFISHIQVKIFIGGAVMAYKDKTNAIKYNNEFNKQAYDRISLMVAKGKKELIQEKAKANGESLNAFINRAIDLLLDK